MHYLSLVWLAWMAGTVSVYWLAPREWRHWVLVAVTIAFLSVHAPVSALLLAGFTLLTYYGTRAAHITGWQAIGVSSIMVGILAFYKIAISGVTGTLVEITVIPLGLSYFTFRCLHLVIERYKTTAAPTSFGDVVKYLVFLPTMVVGPIHRYQQFQRDLRRHRWDFDMLTEGLERILYGYVKIAVLGNYLVSSKLAAFIEDIPPESEGIKLYLLVVKNGLNVYFQFSGFSDIGIGFARLLGFRVIENFNWPYLKPNISEFWQCWHISLSAWCRSYIFDVVIATLRSPALGASLRVVSAAPLTRLPTGSAGAAIGATPAIPTTPPGVSPFHGFVARSSSGPFPFHPTRCCHIPASGPPTGCGERSRGNRAHLPRRPTTISVFLQMGVL